MIWDLNTLSWNTQQKYKTNGPGKPNTNTKRGSNLIYPVQSTTHYQSTFTLEYVIQPTTMVLEK